MGAVVRESDLQKQVIQWCALSLRKDVVYWSTPNERKPSNNLGGMKAMGLLSGVADLIFVSDSFLTGIQVVFIELKAPKTFKDGKGGKRINDSRGGKQSDNQALFQKRVEYIGCDYHIVDNLDDFIDLMKDYNLTK